MLGPLKISYFEKFTMLNDSPYIAYPNSTANTIIVPIILAIGTPAFIAIHTQHSLQHRWPQFAPHLKHTLFILPNLARVPTVFNPVPEPGICLDPHGMFGIFGTHLILKVWLGGK